MDQDDSEGFHQHDYAVKTHPQHVEDEVQRERTLRSIQYLASHVPIAVLKRLSEETKALRDFNVNIPASFLTEEIIHQCYPTITGPKSQERGCASSTIETNSEVSYVSDLSYHSGGNHDNCDRSERVMEPQVEFLLDDDLALAMLTEEGDNYGNSSMEEKLDFAPSQETDERPDIRPADYVVRDIKGKTHSERKNEHTDVVAMVETIHGAPTVPDKAMKSVDYKQEQHEGHPLLSYGQIHQHHDRVEDYHVSERPRRRQHAARRSSLASQVSILSHRYFENASTLPYASKHDSALLFVDISGFTRLSTLLSPEDLSRAINEYFQLIVDEVTHHNGDILKFAGDAVFAEWKVRSNRSTMFKASIEKNVRMNMEDCVTSAAICAAKIVSKYSNHRIEAHPAPIDDSPLTLNVHCGISIGKLVSVHVGDNESRREYLVMGQPIQAVAKAEECAALGEVAACVDSVQALSKTCELQDSLQPVKLTGPVVIANQFEAFFTPVDRYKERYASDATENGLADKVRSLLDSWAIEELIQYRRLLSLYVHPVVICNDKANFDHTQSCTEVQSRQLREAELRNVFVMFIAPIVSMSVTGDEVLDAERLQLLNSIMNLTTSQLNCFGGHLRQYIVDDKGLVLIATFGLRGSTYPKMVAERALPTAQRIQDTLLSDLKLSCRIGCTIGSAYCGVVGSVMRHEYAVLGPSVNLAARLMCSSRNPGILVSDDVCRVTGKSYSFQALGSVKAKGYAKPIRVYEPLSATKKSLGALKTSFVGREEELEKINEMAFGLSQSQLPSARLVIIFGESGLGKTTLMMHGLEQVRYKVDRMKERMVMLSQVCNERDALTPFGSFGPILLAVLSMSQPMGYSSSGLKDSVLSTSSRSLSAHSFHSGSSTGICNKVLVIERLHALCKELNAPPEFAELVGHHLLQADLSSYLEMSENINESATARKKKSLAAFMAEIFQHCTRELDLLVIAIDDIHLADELSWRVIQELFLSASNCLIICTCRPLAQYKLTIDPVFWGDLQSDHAATGKYAAIDLKRMSKLETTEMIAKKMGISNKCVDEHIQRRVFYQSWGIPQFVNVLLDSMKKTEFKIEESSFDGDDEECEEESKSAVSYYSSENLPAYLNQLLLQRIDTFIGSGRIVLNLAATLGLSFQLTDLIAILVHLSRDSDIAGREEYDLAERRARETLDAAVKEGIMYARFCGECNEPELPSSDPDFVPQDCASADLAYYFTHDVWRAAILKLVLDKRKRQLHEAIASTLESKGNDLGDNFISQIRVFNHWKQSGNLVKASDIAFIIGKTYESLGFAAQSAQLYKEAINVTTQPHDHFEILIKLHIAAGRALSTFWHAESVPEYKSALKILEDAPIDYHFPDRSIVFPIFSGLFLLLKSGALPQDEECTYEQELVARYVAETKLHGDPIHYARALAMQAETMAKLGKFEDAVSANSQLRSFYVPELHSERLCNAYGSDRAGQSISMSTVWLMEVGKEKEALETCDLVIHELLPKGDIQNVHNSYMIVYPILLMLESRGQVSLAFNLFKEYVVDPFETYFGEGGTTPSRFLHKPILMLYDLQQNRERELVNFVNYLQWALCEDNLRFGTRKNLASLSFGKLNDLIPAKICLLLAKRPECEQTTKKCLIAWSLAVCRDALALSTRVKSGPCTRSARSLLSEVEEYVNQLQLGAP